MAIVGWYYLHENRSLIYKRELGGTAADIRESSFALAMWPYDPQDRAGAWTILVEALAAGANPQQIAELSAVWEFDDTDAPNYAKRVGALLGKDGNAWCATRRDFTNLQESPAGFGDTALEAMAVLCKELGYKPSKMWGPTFASLLTVEVNVR